ncbi:MAG: type II toxin-antitoxin system VapC family toxin [Gaiellales bacterium]
MNVIDASAIVQALTAPSRAPALVARLIADSDIHAPHLIDVEVASALRRLEHRGELSNDRADDARRDLTDLPLTRYPHQGLLERAWELRHTVSPYDAVYLALAEALDAPLVTCDARLSRVDGVKARIELFAA